MRQSRKPRFVLIFLLALCALFVYQYMERMEDLATLQDKIAAVQERIDHAYEQQRMLEDELAYTGSHDFIDEAARTIFDYGLEGDVVVVPVFANSEAGRLVTGGMLVQEMAREAELLEAFDPHDLPVWQQWVTFFANESGAAH